MFAIDLSSVQSPIIDLSTSAARSQAGLRGLSAINFAAKSKEVLIVGPVHPSAILNYSDVALVNAVIEVVGDAPDVTINADFETVLPGDQFVARIRANREWDWRREYIDRNPLGSDG